MRWHKLELSDKDLDLIVSGLEILNPDDEDMDSQRELLILFIRGLLRASIFEKTSADHAASCLKCRCKERDDELDADESFAP